MRIPNFAGQINRKNKKRIKMVNVVIYLEKNHDAKYLVETLLKTKLIASASIDVNNASYQLVNDVCKENIYTVITVQSKALLFSEIVAHVESIAGKETPIYSTPIVGSNKTFDNIIKSKTSQ